VTLRSRVLEALGTVYDPELDEPITTLGFVGSLAVTGEGDVSVRLRLPTPQCAPNFAFLMAADARAAVERVDGVGELQIELADHYTGDEINAAVGRGEAFSDAFPGETRGELDALRRLFQRKALVAREGRLLAAGPPVIDFVRFERMARLTALSLETNGGMCRDLLRVRYDTEGVAA
jgi:metal-sulfur cluster biosynthetic enzyme